MAAKEDINNSVVEPQSVTPEVKPVEAINNLGQPIWTIKDRSTGELINLHFSGINERKIIWAQKMILHEFPHQDAYNTLSYASSTMKHRLGGIKKLLAYLDGKKEGEKTLKGWGLKDVVAFIKDSAIADNELLSITVLRQYINALRTSYSMRYEQDGIDYSIPVDILARVMPPILDEFDLTFSQWERGGSYGMLPLPVATLLLADAIKLIRSEKCQLLQCYFTSFRDKVLNSTAIKGNRNHQATIIANNISEFITLNPKNRHFKAYRGRVAFVKRLHAINPELTDFPFKSFGQINECVQEIHGACMTILLSVTLMRISECHSVGSDWMEAIEYLDINGEWTVDAILKSKIIKTGGGIVAKRGLSPLGVEVIELLNTLSWVDKEELGLKLFAPTYKGNWSQSKIPTNAVNTIAKKTLRKRLQLYYHKFVARSHKSVAETYPDIIPHNLRHLKMAFGLRKFDGDVEAAIKQEMRHHNHHTQAYSRNKLNEEEESFVKREYVSEVIKRILVNDPQDKWVGPSIKKVRKLAEKLLDGKSIEMLSLLELAEFHEVFNENVHSMTFHSYGCCIVLNDEIKVAQCSIKDNIVIAGSATSTKCQKCTNFCINNKSHEHNMLINKARWQDTADCEIIASFPIVAEAKKMVKLIEKLEVELEANNE
jgi:hypothetical protein